MRDTVAQPRSARIVAALQRLDASAAVIDRHADLIHAAMLDLIAARRSRGFDIGHDDGGAYARPRASTDGPARELRDLRLICRKAIAGKITAQDWTTAWAAMPERIKALWKPLLIETAAGRSIARSMLALGFAAEGFTMLAPIPGIMLPVIERELVKLTATPHPKARTRNAEEAVAIAAIRDAYRAITGHKGGRVIAKGRFAGKLAGKLVDLGRDIDAIFGTTLYAVKDSKRLR